MLHPALIRGAAVLAIGTALAFAHVGFAAACPGHSETLASAELDVETTGSIAGDMAFAENCYFETVPETTPSGKIVLKRLYECD